MLKVLQARLQQYMNRELPDVQSGVRKAEESVIKLPTSSESSKKEREFQGNIDICFSDCTKSFDCVDHASWEICIQVKNQQLELHIEPQTDFKLGKEYTAYLTYMQSTWCEMPHWMKHKLETSLLGEK